MFSIRLKHPVLRAVLLLQLITVLVWLSWLSLRTAAGDSLATFALRMKELDKGVRLQTAAAAVRYAPNDPLTRFRAGLTQLEISSEDFDEATLTTAIEQLRAAARLAPEDYRIWLALGRALSRSSATDAVAEARQALERAVQLAPRHFEPHWALGNFLLRTGEREAACEAFQVPMTNRPDMFYLIFDSVWEAWQGDVPAILRALKTPAPSRPQLAFALVQRQRLPEALAVWKEAEKTPENARQMYEYLFNHRFYIAAYEVWRNAPGSSAPAPDQASLLSNGSFDEQITMDATTPFLTWQISPRSGVSLSLDDRQAHSGRHCLRISFDVRDNGEFILAQQNVTVSPSTSYRLSFAVRSEELKSFSPPLIEVVDLAGRDQLSVAAPPVEASVSAWRESVIDFTTKPKTEAVAVRIIRRACAEATCPLTGRVWFDSFRLAPASR